MTMNRNSCVFLLFIAKWFERTRNQQKSEWFVIVESDAILFVHKDSNS